MYDGRMFGGASVGVGWFAAMVVATFAGCSSDPEPAVADDAAVQDAADVAAPDMSSAVADAAPADLGRDLGPTLDAVAAGPYGAGVRTVEIVDDTRMRTLDVEVWYPTAARGSGDVLDFEVEPNRTSYSDLLAAAPDCPSRTTGAARDAAPLTDAQWPVVTFSHCHACTRYSSFTVAEHLASWGYVVVAPDHERNTLFDELAGDVEGLSTEFLATREGDIRFALDELLAGRAVPELAGALDGERIGSMGHSFGAVTAGLVAQNDPRVDAVMAIAAPMENPLLPGVTVSELRQPMLFLVAVEDNSIREIGNRLIRDNFAKATAPAHKAEVADAGHWSFSDLAGLVDLFAAGCGNGVRHSIPGEPFVYIEPTDGRAIAAAYAVAFFEATLREDAHAQRFLLAPPWEGVVAESNRGD